VRYRTWLLLWYRTIYTYLGHCVTQGGPAKYSKVSLSLTVLLTNVANVSDPLMPKYGKLVCLSSWVKYLASPWNVILIVVNAPAYCTISIVFVTIRNSHPNIIFMSQAGLHFTARHFALLGNIRLGWKQLTVTNSPAYYTISIVFVTMSTSPPSLKFMSKAGLNFTARHLALPGGIRLGWKQLTMTKAPAYCTISIVFVIIRNSHPSLTFMIQAGLHFTARHLDILD